eukprot:16442513-Heterocapsa_arctica.AAC.1
MKNMPMKSDNLPNKTESPSESNEQCFEKNEPMKNDILLKKVFRAEGLENEVFRAVGLENKTMKMKVKAGFCPGIWCPD